MSNTFGKIYRLTTFGESHGPAIGGIIDGVPAGVTIDFGKIRTELLRRRPGQSALTTSRAETDEVEFLSGIMDGVTLGTPVGFICRNSDSRSNDYDNIRDTFRPSHADYTYSAKYGIRDHRGGGRSSARETLSRVVGGAIARQILETMGITIHAYTSAVGEYSMNRHHADLDLSSVYDNDVRCPDPEAASRMTEIILKARSEGDSVGGRVTCVVSGVPAGLGEPVFGKLNAMLGSAMLGINAVKGFEYGMGVDGCRKRGSEMLDTPYMDGNGRIRTRTNNSGGIQGGISNGEDIVMSVAFKPVATLGRPVETVDSEGNRIELHVKGRHDPCVVPRAVPVVEAMAAMTILDAVLMNRCAVL